MTLDRDPMHIPTKNLMKRRASDIDNYKSTRVCN